MNQLQIFNDPKFGQVRTMKNDDGSISINAEDMAIGYGWTQEKNNKTYVRWETINGFLSEFGFSQQVGKDDYIPESLFYRLGMKANNKVADSFQNWLAIEVIPSIRKNGTYQKPLSQLEILQQSVELLQEHDTRLDKLEYDIPLYGCEAKELSDHVKRKGVQVLGGKKSNAYKDNSVRAAVYRDIYDQLKREFGLYDETGRKQTYQWLKRKHIADAHEFIDCYIEPKYLYEQIVGCNNQLSLA